jgi:hypothetical protein
MYPSLQTHFTFPQIPLTSAVSLRPRSLRHPCFRYTLSDAFFWSNKTSHARAINQGYKSVRPHSRSVTSAKGTCLRQILRILYTLASQLKPTRFLPFPRPSTRATSRSPTTWSPPGGPPRPPNPPLPRKTKPSPRLSPSNRPLKRRKGPPQPPPAPRPWPTLPPPSVKTGLLTSLRANPARQSRAPRAVRANLRPQRSCFPPARELRPSDRGAVPVLRA